MLYSPFTYFKETARLLVQKRLRDGQLAFLGDTDAPGARTEVPDAPGYVYARFQNVPDANGNATFTAPFLVRSGNAAFQNYPGASVYVAVGYNGELEIVSANYQELTRNGIDTRTLNPLHQQSKWVYLWQLTIGLCSAVGNSVNGSYLVTVKKYLRYFDNVFAASETGAQADKIDLQSVVPAVDMHRYATVWLDAYTGDFEVTTSTAQSLFTTMDDSDLLETVVNRPPDAVPHKTFYLANNQGTITQQPVADRDVRQFLNMPAVHGFPNPVTYRERIHPDKQQLFAGSMVVTGSLEVLGSLIGVPTVSGSGGGSGGSSGITELTGDVTAGPGSGSQVATLANTAVAPGSYTNTALTVDSKGRITNASSGAAPVIDFDVAADSGTPATIEDGDTVTLAGGTGLSSAIAGNTVTLNLDNTAVTPMQYINPVGLTVDAQGRITQLFEGAPLYPDYISPGAFAMRKIDNQTIDFGVGYAEIASETVRKTEITRVDVAAASWGIGSEAASQVIWFFMNAGGFIVPFAAGPNAPDPATAETPKATMLVNQSGWNGTAASGLNATSVVYDNDTGEGNVTPGDIVIVYASSDSDYSVSRGRSSGAAGSSNFVSAALITAIDTGTNTLTLEAGHNIAINDNDRLLVVPRGALIYRWYSGTLHRFIGSMYNNASSNLEDNRLNHAAYYNANQGSNYTISSTTLTEIDATNWRHALLCDGRPVMCNLTAAVQAAAGFMKFDILLDGVAVGGDDGILSLLHQSNAVLVNAGLHHLLMNVLPGTHTFSIAWRTTAGGGITMYAGAGTANVDIHPQWSVCLTGG